MTRGEHDPELAEQTIRALAAVTDAELSADIRAAVAEVATRLADWRGSGEWRGDDFERGLAARVTVVLEALAELPADTPPNALASASSPILGVYWPNRPASAAAVDEAVEHLRRVAMHRPRFVQEARRFRARDLE